MSRDKFDQLFDSGSAAVLTGRHRRDTPPTEGGPRWGVSVIFRPGEEAVARLDAVTREVMAVAGPGHWPTGGRAASHITVRSLAAHHTDVPEAGSYRSALRLAARRTGPVRFAATGLTLTTSGVMACLRPADGSADEFAANLADALGADGAYQTEERDIWYSTLVHFAGPIPDGRALVDFVAARRRRSLGDLRIDEAELMRWRYDGTQPVRVPLAVELLTGL